MQAEKKSIGGSYFQEVSSVEEIVHEKTFSMMFQRSRKAPQRRCAVCELLPGLIQCPVKHALKNAFVLLVCFGEAVGIGDLFPDLRIVHLLMTR